MLKTTIVIIKKYRKMVYEYKHIENLTCPEHKINELAKQGWKLKGGLHLIAINATGQGFTNCNVYSCTLERKTNLSIFQKVKNYIKTIIE